MQLLSEKLSQQSHLAVRLIEFCRKQWCFFMRLR
jgi:hypothetical protein